MINHLTSNNVAPFTMHIRFSDIVSVYVYIERHVICAIYVQLNITSLVSTQAHTKTVEDVREDITKLKEDISSLKEEMANLVQTLTSRVEAAGFN